MARGDCDNRGGKRAVLRLIFYIAAVMVVCGVFAIVLWKCLGDTAQGGDEGAKGITFVLNNGEEDVVCGIADEVPSPSKQGYYLYGWYTDESLSKRIEFDSIADILDEENEGKFGNGEYKLYAKWRELMEMTGVRMKDTFFIYDGISHEMEIEGLPEGASVEYEGEEEYVDAGEYEVVAVVRAYGYNELKITGKLTIRKAIVDISEIEFASRTEKWDGSEKRIEVVGELPSGVSVRYENNGHTEIGEYEVTAIFDCNQNYESIPNKTAILRIVAETYEITFVEEDGTRRTVVVESGSVLEDVPKPKEKLGYDGMWSIRDFGSLHGDVTVTAVYELVGYGIEYELNGGELGEGYVTKYTVNDVIRLEAATREYYVFEGWYEDVCCEGERIEEIPVGSVGERKYYAKWSKREYTVRYELNGGNNNAENMNSGDEYVYTVGEEDFILQEPLRYGYKFVRWKNENEETVTVISASNPSTRTVYAEWDAIRYGITYMLNGGENGEGNPDTYTVESGDIVLAKPSREKYRFVGWYEDEGLSGERIEVICGSLGRNITVYAKWEKIVYTVEEVDGKNIITACDYYFGYDLVIPKEIEGKEIDGIARGVLCEAERVEIEGMEEINGDAFAGCVNLVELILPDTLNRLPEGMLAECVSLRNLTVPFASDRRIGSVYGKYLPLSTLFGKSAREGCYEVAVRAANLSEGQSEPAVNNVYEDYMCYVPKSLEEITVLGGDVAPYAMYGLAKVKRVKIVGECRWIGAMALAGCTALERVELPYGVETVKQSAFNGCTSLSEIRIHVRDDSDADVLSNALNALKDKGIEPEVVKIYMS